MLTNDLHSNEAVIALFGAVCKASQGEIEKALLGAGYEARVTIILSPPTEDTTEGVFFTTSIAEIRHLKAVLAKASAMAFRGPHSTLLEEGA